MLEQLSDSSDSPNEDYEGDKMYSPVRVNYHRYSPINGLLGFIVNVHDAVNYDIDFRFNKEQQHRYSDVINNVYFYRDLLESSASDNPQPQTESTDEQDSEGAETGEYSSIAYRCRLRGVGIEGHEKGKTRTKSQRHNANSKLAVMRLIDRTGGWVICNVSDVDVYNRLLVDIFVPVAEKRGKGVSVREFLLTSSALNFGGLFRPYGLKGSNGERT